MHEAYQIAGYDVPGYATADGVLVNAHGAWLAEWGILPTGPHRAQRTLLPLVDEDGEYIAAPADWRRRIRTDDAE